VTSRRSVHSLCRPVREPANGFPPVVPDQAPANHIEYIEGPFDMASCAMSRKAISATQFTLDLCQGLRRSLTSERLDRILPTRCPILKLYSMDPLTGLARFLARRKVKMLRTRGGVVGSLGAAACWRFPPRFRGTRS